MTAKRRTFRGRRRTLKGGNCCDYETQNQTSSMGCVNESANYAVQAAGLINHGDIIQNRAQFRDAECVNRPIDLINLNIGNLIINIQYHALKHMDMYDDFNTCNKQYEYLEALKNILIDKSDEILESATNAIVSSTRALANANGLPNRTINEKQTRKQAIYSANSLKNIKIVVNDFFGIKTEIQMDVEFNNPIYKCVVFRVQPVPSAHKHDDNFKEKFNIYSHTDVIKHEAIDDNMIAELGSISGRTQAATLKSRTRVRLNEIAREYRLQPFKSFTLAPGLKFLKLLNQYIKRADNTKSGCINGRRTYQHLFEFVSEDSNRQLIAGMIHTVRNPGQRVNKVDSAYIEKVDPDYNSEPYRHPEEISEYESANVNAIIDKLKLNDGSVIRNQLIDAANERIGKVKADVATSQGLSASANASALKSAKEEEDEAQRKSKQEASKASRKKEEAARQSVEETKTIQEQIIAKLELFKVAKEEEATEIMEDIIKLYTPNSELDRAIADHINSFKPRSKQAYITNIKQVVHGSLTIPPIFNIKKGGNRITKKRKTRHTTKTRRRAT